MGNLGVVESYTNVYLHQPRINKQMDRCVFMGKRASLCTIQDLCEERAPIHAVKMLTFYRFQFK
jgi:hypothetical protein